MARALTTFALLSALVLALGAGGCAQKTGVAFTDLQYPRATKSVKVGTAEIAYTEAGQGEHTLVLIHGLGSYLPAWNENIDALAADYRVIAIDLPGYGKSSKASWSYSMEFFAKAVRGVVRELGIERPILVGHSMGGQIAMTYALAWPEDVQALVLTSPAGLETFEDGEAKWLAGATTPEFTCGATEEAIYVRHAQNFHRMPKDAEFMVEDRVAVIGGPDFRAYCRAVSRSVAGMLDAPVADRIPEIGVPTLVVFGESDQLIPNPFLHGGSTEKLAKKAVRRFPDAELVMIERAGHMAHFEQPADWNAAVLRFLARARQAAPTGARLTPKTHEDGDEVQDLYAPGTDPDDAPAKAPAAAEPGSPSAPTPAPPPAPSTEPTSAAPGREPQPEPQPELLLGSEEESEG
jgi:pimeloyl-ACP methyl ester carboxylesterase